jgi:hypothetical protein
MGGATAPLFVVLVRLVRFVRNDGEAVVHRRLKNRLQAGIVQYLRRR